MNYKEARGAFGFDIIVECLVVDYLGIVIGVNLALYIGVGIATSLRFASMWEELPIAMD